MKYMTLLAASAAALILPSVANAAVTVKQYGTTSLGAFSYSVSGHTITLNETWTNNNNVFLVFDGLDDRPYQIIKNVLNNTGTSWTSIANELLDPSVDRTDPSPQPSFVPTGYSTSNDSDGLSFNQGGSSVRSATIFPNIAVDELSNARDFIDFYGATVNSGTSFTLKYGIVDTTGGGNQPFLLSQRVNVRSLGGVPEPTTWAMMLLGFGGMGYALRHRRSGTRIRFA